MKRQTTGWNCGPASVQNALRFFGRRRGQGALACAAGTSSEGTDELGIQAALNWAQVGWAVIKENRPTAAWAQLMNVPVICCINRWEHWVTVLGVAQNRVLYFDPAKEDHLMAELNVVTLSRRKFMKRWEAARRVRGTGARFYGIQVLG
jgi:ABC-type bacteriocin/lantibiotic exporter with double-glycine peptidase domain